MKFREWLTLRESLALKGNYKGSWFQRLVAAKYMLAPTFEPRALPAFLDLAKKINRQSEFLKSKYEMSPTLDDPYPSMKDMTNKIQRQLDIGVKKPQVKVFAEPPGGGIGHPTLSNDENVSQRWVHDIIAHYFGQFPFSARGEYSAYNKHLQTLCNPGQVKSGNCLAAKAIFTEVVGQTSCYYIYGSYVPQKAVILDDFDHYRVGLLAPASPLNKYFQVESKTMVKRPDFNWDVFVQDQPELANELTRQEKTAKVGLDS